MNKKIIGLCGLAESGKSTAARFLKAQVIPFAKPLKDMLAVLGLTQEQLYGSEKEVPSPILGNHTPRHAMQTLGTEWGRQLISPSIWTSAWLNAVRASTAAVVVCDDVRFPNEVNLIRSLGGTVIALQRDSAVRGQHISESLDYESFGIPIINNNGSREYLFSQLEMLTK